jgi:hypothetical protein
MLLGTDLHVFTNHKNLTFYNLHVKESLTLEDEDEEHSPILHYIKSEKNILAIIYLRYAVR